MRSTKHSDHNVVTAALETLQQLLQSPPSKLLFRLLSNEGLGSISNRDDKGLYQLGIHVPFLLPMQPENYGASLTSTLFPISRKIY